MLLTTQGIILREVNYKESEDVYKRQPWRTSARGDMDTPPIPTR